jgi:hypothetical protein
MADFPSEQTLAVLSASYLFRSCSEEKMAIDRKAFLDLWNLVDMPACDAGMELATRFLERCGEGVDRLGTEEPSDRITEMNAAYMELVTHGVDCDECKEANDDPSGQS